MSDKKNYLLIHNTRRKEFIFHDFKTANKYKEVIVPVSKELNKVINKFLKMHPDRKYLLQQMRNPKPLSRNSLGKLIPQIFSATGKNVTLNIIRHVYVTEKVDLEAVKQFQEIAKNMHHSFAEQTAYNKGC
jgi:integrase